MRNAAETLERQIQAVASQVGAGPFEVIVADNGSRDGSAGIARRCAAVLPCVRVVDASDRRGASYVRNVGVAAAKGPLLAFCDADDVVKPGWLAALIEAALTADAVCGLTEEESLNQGRVIPWRHQFPAPRLPTVIGFMPYAHGGNCAIWTDVLHDLGGWNEEYLTGTDVELFWRLQLASYELRLADSAMVAVRWPSTLWRATQQAYAHGCSHPQLYRQFRAHGLPRSSVWQAIRTWAWFIKRLPGLLDAPRRHALVRDVAYRFGRLRGSVRFRVLFP